MPDYWREQSHINYRHKKKEDWAQAWTSEEKEALGCSRDGGPCCGNTREKPDETDTRGRAVF